MSANVPGQLSPDGSFYWNGRQWVSTLSPDGVHRWDGSAWVPVAAPVAAPRPAVRPSGLGFQFGGSAAWSIGFGLASLLAPLFAQYYFVLLPLFGLYRGYIAVRAGRTAGGVIGIGLNIVGGIMSLLASGLLRP